MTTIIRVFGALSLVGKVRRNVIRAIQDVSAVIRRESVIQEEKASAVFPAIVTLRGQRILLILRQRFARHARVSALRYPLSARVFGSVIVA